MITKNVIQIPFPAWEGIYLIEEIRKVLRRNKMFCEVPDFRTPRRITLKAGTLAEGFDDVKVVELWMPGGSYAVATLGGRDNDSCGTSWEIISLRLAWVDRELGLSCDEKKIKLVLGHEQLKAIRVGMGDQVVRELAKLIRLQYERQLVWTAVVEAESQGLQFSHFPQQNEVVREFLPAKPLVEDED